MTTRIPRNLLVADRIALGLSRAQLLTVGAATLVAYGAWRGLPAPVGVVAAIASVAGGALLAIASWEDRPMQEWLALAVWWALKRRPLLVEVDPCS